MADQKELVWVGSSRKDLQEFPKEVRSVFGVALYWAQNGVKS
jgi:phage-related protein